MNSKRPRNLTPANRNQLSSARPGLVQPKIANAPLVNKRPLAPAVYKPGPIPRVLQPKAINNPKQAVGNQPRLPPASPPVYRPQPLPKVLQTKYGNAGAKIANPKSTGKQQANNSIASTVGKSNTEIRRNPAPPFAQRHQTAVQPSSQKRPGDIGSSVTRQPTFGLPAQNRQIRPSGALSIPLPQVLQSKLSYSQGRGIVPPGNAARIVQLKPSYEKYKSWLDDQAIPMNLRTTLNARLVLAQNAIAYTRQKLIHGAGNITEQIETSHKFSVVYTKAAYDREDALSDLIPRPQQTPAERVINLLVAQAITSRKTRAGNCDHFAAVVLLYLVEHAPQNSGKLYRLGVGGNDNGHSVVIYADDGWKPTVASDQDSYHTAVVVDAWPTHAFAIAWRDWKYKDDNPTIVIGLRPMSDGVSRERVLRNYRTPLKASNEYQQLQDIKQRSTRNYELNQSEWLRGDAQTTTRYRAWTDEHPLFDKHPSDKCFITSACVEAKGFSDDCDQLNTLRAFRDGYMLNLPIGEELITEYYQLAPRILKQIRNRPDPQMILSALYEQIEDCLTLIRDDEYEAALWHYVNMVENLRNIYLTKG